MRLVTTTVMLPNLQARPMAKLPAAKSQKRELPHSFSAVADCLTAGLGTQVDNQIRHVHIRNKPTDELRHFVKLE